ncbi:hypothetical protein K9B32_10265 [Rhizobium sp. 3T7]|uniref:hypothetical protein n=1 Tax=Rhizobium sp. 3T7 TaxID=2874922 RepID=UPI001CC95918|nr:hypothetical protein [Rhizobium sp. 3T7]MBZ9790504.1 hypothetical protein [Rhizobium sp. 3T7]
MNSVPIRFVAVFAFVTFALGHSEPAHSGAFSGEGAPKIRPLSTASMLGPKPRAVDLLRSLSDELSKQTQPKLVQADSPQKEEENPVCTVMGTYRPSINEHQLLTNNMALSDVLFGNFFVVNYLIKKCKDGGNFIDCSLEEPKIFLLDEKHQDETSISELAKVSFNNGIHPDEIFIKSEPDIQEWKEIVSKQCGFPFSQAESGMVSVKLKKALKPGKFTLAFAYKRDQKEQLIKSNFSVSK